MGCQSGYQFLSRISIRISRGKSTRIELTALKYNQSIFPSRPSKNIAHSQPPCAGLPHVIPDVDPLMESDPQWVIAVDIFREAVNHFFAFGLKAAEEAV